VTHTKRQARAATSSLLIACLFFASLTAVHAAPRPINVLPAISGTPAASVEAGTAYRFRPTATDANGDTLRFKIQGRPGWAAFDSVTGTLSGTPNLANAGTYANIVISVTDGKRGNTWVSLPAFSITVEVSRNLSPEILGNPPTSAVTGQTYSVQPNASDPDGDPLTYAVANMPAWATFSPSTGRLSGTPTTAGTHSGITISVSDGAVSTSLPAFSITVQQPNRAPTISGSPATSATVGTAYAFQPTATDPDGNTLTYAVANPPAWATFSPSTGRLSGTPTSSAAGLTFSGITISVSDGTVSTSLPAFSISVQQPNRAPTISGTPATSATVGAAYAFQPNASDPDGNTLTYAVANPPAWATFSTSTGRLSGTPTTAGTHSGIIISVSDGTVSTALPAFSITVQSGNRAPTISGSPATSATVGTAYAFQPNASDPDGNTLTYSIVNRPAWATFSTSTGSLSGTPSSAYAGTTTSNIVISAFDGTVSTALPAFSITVRPATSGSATLSWTPPTTNSDGTPLVNLAGFRIVYGQASRQYSQVLDIASPVIATAMIENLSAGTWYFAVKAYTSAGVESDVSNEASKTIL